MANDVCFIRRTTLEEIADAIRTVKGIEVKIPVSVLKQALLTGEVTTTAPTDTAAWYRIRRQTLVDIADGVRQIDETTSEIVGAELAARILALAQIPDTPTTVKLATPVIALYDENGIIEPEYTTSAILGEAILGYCILGSAGDGITRQQLDTPVIYLYDDEADNTTTVQLDTPVIYLYDDEAEPEITVVQLATPIIELVTVSDDGEEEEPVITTIQLDTPIIYLEEVTDDSGEEEPTVTIIQLATPVIELVEVAEEEPDIPDEPEEPTIIQLATPVIYLYEVAEEEPEEPDVPDVPVEPTIVQLDTPVVYLEEVAEEEPDVPDVPEEPTIIQLDTPVIELVEIKEEVEPEEPDVPDGLVKMTYNSSGYINSNGEFFEPSGLGLKYSQLISLWILANGSDGWCVWSEFSSPTEIKIFYYDNDNKLVGTLGYEDYLSRGLTAEFIVGYAANNYPTATQAIFTLDTSANDAVDAIYVYEVEEEEEYKLATPVIELVVA